MKNKLILGLSLLALAGAVHAAATVKPYDFNSIVATGTVASAGIVTLTVGNQSDSKTVASGEAYRLSVTGLTDGKVYAYNVTGADTGSGEVVLGNGTGKLFGADADGDPEVLGGSWNTTAYPAPDRTTKLGFYTLAGTSNRFDVTTSPSGKIVYIDSEVTFSDGADELEPFEALGAFTLAQTNETDETYFWAGLVKEGGVAKWVELTAGSVTPARGAFTFRMEFDFNSNPAKVRYWIKGATGDATGDFVLLKNGSTEWFDVAKTAAENVASVSFEGTGQFAAFEGSSFNTDVAQVGSTKYATIADALTNNKGGTVTLLTNTKPAANEALSGNNWTITVNGNSFEPYETTGYTFTYEDTAFAVMPYQTSVNVAGSTKMGYDFTNGTVNVKITGSHIQSGTSVSATVTVKNAAGTQIASQTFSDIAGDTDLELKVADPLTRLGDYKYEVVIKKGDDTIKTVSDTFVAGNDANWFSACKDRWAQDGSWKKNGESVDVSGEKLDLGGNQYDFTPVEPSISNAIVRVDTVIELNGAIDSEDLPAEDDVQGMIALVETDGATPTTAWKAYVGSTWKPLTGGATEAGTYTIRAEFDYRGATKKVRYSVAKGDDAFVVLKDNGNEWIDNGVQTATTLEGTSAMGAGNLVSLKGDNIDAFVAEVDGVRYETMADALAAAAGEDVKLLWDCTWTPGLNGQWIVNVNGKNLIVYGADGWQAALNNGVLKASNVKVAKVDETEYFFLDEAFADVAENGTVKMLTNLVQSVNVAVANNAILDLASWFVSGAGTLNVGDGKTLVFTNSTSVAGGFGMDVTGLYSICGGKWVTNDGTLGTNYKFFELAEKPTVDDVIYNYEAMFTTIEPTNAKVYPVKDKDGDNSVGDAVVTDAFVSKYLPGITDPVAIATKLNQPPAVGNGLPLIQSYVLNLTPTDPTSKPVVGAVQNAEASQVTLSLGTLTVNKAAGVPVQFSLSTAAAADFSGATESAKQDSSEFNVDIGSDKKLQYYKINIYFGK